MQYVVQFHQSDSAKALFAQYVRDIITRTNRYTGKPYSEDPAIFSWQIGNEPRAFSNENKEAFAVWIGEVAKLIKSLDSNHLVSIGSEGRHGCEQDMDLYRRIGSYPEVDYLNAHIWPYNWGWITRETVSEGVETAIANTQQYVDDHLEIAAALSKPLTIEEFGYPRDGFVFTPASAAAGRESYYAFIFSLVAQHAANGGLLAGCNFWGWGGFARPEHLYWQKGDDYAGDPAQEEQGLNSVFSVDEGMLQLIKNANEQLTK